VDDLPPAVDIDKSFASYHSKTEVQGNVLHYTRVYEVKQLTITVDQMDDLRKFYRIVATDERSTAVLKPSPSAQGAASH
jgi:adenylate cyclase class IV